MKPTQPMLIVACLVAPQCAMAQQKATLGYTAVADYASAFATAENGYFKKRGLDVEMQLVAINSTLPAGLESGSIQIGGPTPSVFLQAVDGGLDHVAIAGGSAVDRASKSFGVVARTGSGIAKAADFEGKRVGVPGLGAFLHVMFRKWLMDAGADPRKVIFTEVSFAQMNDVLRSGTVDAVVTGEPVMSRMVAASTGSLVTNLTENLKAPIPAVLYTSTRAYAQSNPKVVSEFRAAIAEGAAFVAGNPDAARTEIAKYTKLAPELVKSIPLPSLSAELSERELQDWVEIMSAQKMLSSKLDVSKLHVE